MLSLRALVPRASMVAAFILPLNSSDKWAQESYSHAPKNQVTFSKVGLNIHVDKSASPLIYKFESLKKISAFKITGIFKGLPKLTNLEVQGEKGFDDYSLRIGFVVPGNKYLTGLKKLIAPQWVKSLYSKVPSGLGIDHIEFFDITQNSKQIGLTRKHPTLDLIEETFFDFVARDGAFNYSYQLKMPVQAAAVWISSDGDDTASTYDVSISTIELSVIGN